MKNKLTLTIIGAIILIFSVITFNFLKENVSLNFGAPSQINIVSSTSSPPVSFTVGTTTAATQFGTTTVAIYGSTTIQTSEDTEYALWVQNAASSTVFQVDTVNSSTTAFGTFNTGVLNVASCSGCTGGNLTFDWFSFADYMTPTTTLGIYLNASSTIYGGLDMDYSTSTNATSTDFSTTRLNIGGNVLDELCGTGITCTGTLSASLGTDITASEIADGDHGDFTYSGGSATLDADVVSDSEIDYASVTLADFTNDADFIKWAMASSTLMNFNAGLISSASSTIQALQVQDTLQASTTSTFAGIYINAAGELRIPSGTAPTIATAGDIALDTTNGQLVYFNAQENVLSSTTEMSFEMGTTTRSGANSAGFGVATTTIQLRRPFQPVTLNEIVCDLDNNSSSSTVEIGDGTNTTTPITVGGDASFPNGIALTTNNTFTAGERMFFSVGSAVGTPNTISCTILYVKTRQ